jgi:hypothetical protein
MATLRLRHDRHHSGVHLILHSAELASKSLHPEKLRQGRVSDGRRRLPDHLLRELQSWADQAAKDHCQQSGGASTAGEPNGTGAGHGAVRNQSPRCLAQQAM